MKMTNERWIYDYWNFISFTIGNQSSLSYWLCFVRIYIYIYQRITRRHWPSYHDDGEEEEEEEESVQVVSSLSI